MDTLTKQKRSWNMSRIRGRDTAPERAVRSLLHRMGYRFRLDRTDLPGRPDIVLPKYRTVIFVHGCFWHRHRQCKYAYTPKSRQEFWQSKFDANVRRDQRVRRKLVALGWHVIVVWECQIKAADALASSLDRNLRSRASKLVGRAHRPRPVSKTHS